MQIIFIYK